jgi:hypothetical protein
VAVAGALLLDVDTVEDYESALATAAGGAR